MRGTALAMIFAGLVIHTGLIAVAKEDPRGNTPVAPAPQTASSVITPLALGSAWHGRTRLETGTSCATAHHGYTLTPLPGGKVRVQNDAGLDTHSEEMVTKDGVTSFGFHGNTGWLVISVQNQHVTLMNGNRCIYSLNQE